ncbi:nuclear transport factor 2 family protein [Streptomyces sp. NPDC004726]
MTNERDHEARRRRAHEVVDQLHERLLAHDMMGFADLWAPEGTMDFPFAPPGWAAPRSRAEVREYVRDYNKSIDPRAIRHQTRHETGDPDTLIVEWGVDAVAVAAQKPFPIDYVAVITVGEEGITSYRDYWNALGAGIALGRLPGMVRAYEAAGAGEGQPA